MGHHYVPQAYLRQFEDPSRPGMIWSYGKRERRVVLAPIKTVAQESGYYDAEDEERLNRIVEIPANCIFRKLRQRSPLAGDDREKLELYVGTMLMRVPHRRRKAGDLYPKVLDEILDDVASQIRALVQQGSVSQEIADQRLAQIDGLRGMYRSSPPAEIVDLIRNPWPSDNVMTVVRQMTWRIVEAPRGFHFLTSDNPAHFFEFEGLASKQSEMTFPLASDLALIANWQGPPRGLGYARLRPALVREVNRRVASNAEYAVFYHAREERVADLAVKVRPYLSRIQWDG